MHPTKSVLHLQVLTLGIMLVFNMQIIIAFLHYYVH